MKRSDGWILGLGLVLAALAIVVAFSAGIAAVVWGVLDARGGRGVQRPAADVLAGVGRPRARRRVAWWTAHRREREARPMTPLGPGWVEVFPFAPEPTDDERRAAQREWIESRPDAVRALMRRFPPLATVSALVPLVCPAPGRTGEVVSYFEPDDENPEGTIGVLGDSAIGPVKAQCRPSDLVLESVAGVDPFALELLGFARMEGA